MFELAGLKWGTIKIIGIRDIRKMPRKMPAAKKCLITVVNWCWLWSDWRSRRNLKGGNVGRHPGYARRWLCLGWQKQVRMTSDSLHMLEFLQGSTQMGDGQSELRS